MGKTPNYPVKNKTKQKKTSRTKNRSNIWTAAWETEFLVSVQSINYLIKQNKQTPDSNTFWSNIPKSSLQNIYSQFPQYNSK